MLRQPGMVRVQRRRARRYADGPVRHVPEGVGVVERERRAAAYRGREIGQRVAARLSGRVLPRNVGGGLTKLELSLLTMLLPPRMTPARDADGAAASAVRARASARRRMSVSLRCRLWGLWPEEGTRGATAQTPPRRDQPLRGRRRAASCVGRRNLGPLMATTRFVLTPTPQHGPARNEPRYFGPRTDFAQYIDGCPVRRPFSPAGPPRAADRPPVGA